MTVLAWDGKSLAADKQMTRSGERCKYTKLHRLTNGEVAAYTGSVQDCLGLLNWYVAGAKTNEWNDFRVDTEASAELIVLSEDGLYMFSNGPYAVKVEDPFAAFGSGKEYALGALTMGATAEQAVEIASQHDTHCGLGVDVMQFERPKKKPRNKKR